MWSCYYALQEVEGFPYSSFGKESACNAGDHSLIPGLGRSAGEGIGYPLQYSWASLVAQVVKNPPAMKETWVRSLGWEDLEKGKATHSSILAWKIPWTIQSMGSRRVGHNWTTFTSLHRVVKTIETKSRMVVLFRGWVGRGNRELLYEYRVSVLQVLRLVAQQYEYTQYCWTIHLKMIKVVNFMLFLQ